MLSAPHLIRDARTGRQSEKAIQDGIIRGTLNKFQRQAVDGVLTGGMPEHSTPVHEVAQTKKGKKPNLSKSGKAPATQGTMGKMPYPGSTKSV